jgi:hypothetical protein
VILWRALVLGILSRGTEEEKIEEKIQRDGKAWFQ